MSLTNETTALVAPIQRQISNGFQLQQFHIPARSHDITNNNAAQVSKLKRHSSKLLSLLRSWTRNSASSTSDSFPHKLSQKSSSRPLPSPEHPTIVHRTQFKSRPSVISISMDKGMLDVTPEVSPSTSVESGSGKSSGKSSMPRPGESTGKTSLGSSTKSKAQSQHSSENKKIPKLPKQSVPMDFGSNENAFLTPIAEVESFTPEPIPTVVTVEKAAAAKIFFETHYNVLTSDQPTPRSLRHSQLECALYNDTLLSPGEKDNLRGALAKQESNHLREVRIMKVRGANALKGKDFASSKYEVVKILGKGSFGVVRLVREKAEPGLEKRKEIYAMKVIRKSDMLRNSQEGHLRAERDFLVAAEGSRWVVPLIASFQDLDNLYLVMDYMPGGDFLGLLIRDNVLSEQVTKWYIAEMILCIEEAHSLRWIHRDIKPDNFLISASGHLKISDFGLAFDGHWSHDQGYFNNHRYSLLTKLGIYVDGDSLDRKEGRSIARVLETANTLTGQKDRHERNSLLVSESEGLLNWRNRNGNRTLARSVVGTSQYMAPEVIRGELYDARCDWWSVAVILYECLYGHTPFLAEEGGRQQTKANIAKHKSTFGFPAKPQVSKRCQDLIRNIIQEKEHRLCSKRYRLRDIGLPSGSRFCQDYAGRYVYANDAEDIKNHKWFKDVQWDRIHTMTPPFVPNIKSNEDTFYFDEEDPISDFSESLCQPPPTVENLAQVLKSFPREIQVLVASYIEHPHDSVRMRNIEKEIDNFNVPDEQKQYLWEFVKKFGKKEKKRPRDRLLRDREVAPKVLELRKKGAFLGYTYRRARIEKLVVERDRITAGDTLGEKSASLRPRLSIH